MDFRFTDPLQHQTPIQKNASFFANPASATMSLAPIWISRFAPGWRGGPRFDNVLLPAPSIFRRSRSLRRISREEKPL